MDVQQTGKGMWLVLENQRADFETVARGLGSLGWGVERAETETEAKEKLRSHAAEPRYAGAILDVMVPVGRPRVTSEPGEGISSEAKSLGDSLEAGVRVCKYIRNDLHLADLMVVFYTILSSDDLRIPLAECGALYCGKVDYAYDRQALFRFLPK